MPRRRTEHVDKSCRDNTAKGASCVELFVDDKTGKAAQPDRFAGGEGVTARKAQNEAISEAKTPLQAAVSKDGKANERYKAVSATPSLNDGHPTADITLM